MGNTASEQENGFTKSSSYSALNIQNRNGHIYANANNSNSSGNINGHLHGIGGTNIKQRPVPVISVGTHRKKSVSTTSLSSLNAKYNNNNNNTISYEKRLKNFICGNNISVK
jgi:hypothetical protein